MLARSSTRRAEMQTGMADWRREEKVRERPSRRWIAERRDARINLLWPDPAPATAEGHRQVIAAGVPPSPAARQPEEAHLGHWRTAAPSIRPCRGMPPNERA
jgi:hypothetical protein